MNWIIDHADSVPRLLPGDPVALMLNGRGGGEAASPQDIARVSAELGFDGPIVEQYARALAGAAHGDFGQSIQSGLPVSGMISAALPRTLQLGAAALILSLVAGTALAVSAPTSSKRTCPPHNEARQLVRPGLPRPTRAGRRPDRARPVAGEAVATGRPQSPRSFEASRKTTGSPGKSLPSQ